MSRCRFAPVALPSLALIVITTAILLRARTVYALCDPPSEATPPAQRDDCGDADWELTAYFGGQPWDEGDWSAPGACSIDYTDCDCNYHQVASQPATKQFEQIDEGSDGGGGEYYAWWWNLYGYSGWSEPTCTSGPCSGFDYVQYPAVPLQNANTLYAGYDEEDESCVF